MYGLAHAQKADCHRQGSSTTKNYARRHCRL